jgi:hypothetical protein
MQAFRENWGIDRRARIRYPIELKVRYRSLATGHPVEGTGQTVDMSSTGLRVCSENKFSKGARIEVSVQWPSELEDGVHLQLVAVGKVVRCDERTFAVEFHTYEFRTMKHELQPSAGQSDGAWQAGCNEPATSTHSAEALI